MDLSNSSVQKVPGPESRRVAVRVDATCGKSVDGKIGNVSRSPKSLLMAVLWTSALALLSIPSFAAKCLPAETIGRTGALESGSARSPAASGEPKCSTNHERDQITIACDYTQSAASTPPDGPRIILNDAFLSFETGSDNYMHLDLTFTNGGTSRIEENRKVYLEIDDDAGHNYMRRPLPIDLSTLVPNAPLKISTRLLSGAFRPGHYIIYLWIPSSDASLKFSSAHNLLLSSVGVADRTSGLNKVADFTVAPVEGRKSGRLGPLAECGQGGAA